ncbi:capsular polysaccharide export protein, LipB/KpsS family [Rhodovarius crocodyli]|uniref:capsular polysaccharide export protein, LipB/KpsS family n=1 Tax=Rhodovarius crocodyli TaxID=1979269 RepID=UPI0013E3966F|nr:hypothetical protein [Rhodovarius crocodyli]
MPAALLRRWPHLPGFLPDYAVVPGAGPGLVAGEILEEPWTAPAFAGAQRPVALVFPGLPRTEATPDPDLLAAMLGCDPAPLAAALPYTRFACPFTGRPLAAEEAVAILALWRGRAAENHRVKFLLHMQKWKRRDIGHVFGTGAGHPPFAETPAEAMRPGAVVAAWAARVTAQDEALAARQGTEIWRVEDGFLRSVGLGVNFAPAASLAVDPLGIHYDPSRPSLLETILAQTDFTPGLQARAAALRGAIAARNITKYNVAGQAVPLPPSPGRARLLVVGQVEDDASIRLGAAEIRTNLGLLAAVRAANPDAFIAFKPHPDVETGYRRGYVPDRAALRYADTVTRAPIGGLFGQVQALHSITSLAGFEALLRGLSVTCWGRPFYAGWGLTTDMAPPPRRGRALSLDALVAGCLILYPRYHDPVTQLPCTPEIVLARLADPAAWPALPAGRRAYLLWWKFQGRLLKLARQTGVWRR